MAYLAKAEMISIATNCLSAKPQLLREEQFGEVYLCIFEASGVYPREWTCIVSTSSGDCYSSSQDLQSFQKLVLDANADPQSTGDFEEWFTLVAPRKFLLMTAKRHPELFGQDHRLHDPAIVSGAFEFFCQDTEVLQEGDGITHQKLYKFKIMGNGVMVVEEVE